MATLRDVQRNWEGFAQVDPLWAICSDPEKRGNKWDRQEFFLTGEREITAVLDHLRSLKVLPSISLPVLDFGCGVGRLTRALSKHFPVCWGVDISQTMVQLAKEYNEDRPQCHFVVNDRSDLRQFADGYFGFVYSSIVLQHIPRRHVSAYLVDMLRVLAHGGILVFQVPESCDVTLLWRLRDAVGFRRKLTRLLGRRSSEAYRMEMNAFPEKQVRRLLTGQKMRVADVRFTNSAHPAFNGNLVFMAEAPQASIVSKQYCVLKI